MEAQNTLVRATANDKAVEFDCGGETVKLSPSIIRKYLVNGNGNVSDQEVVMFLNLCRFQHLNPFLKEAYLIKYGNQPATMVVGKEVLTKRAMRNPKYAGLQAGVVVYNADSGNLENRIGAITLPNEQLIGGWCKVYVKGYENPVEIAVSFDEYCLKKDGKPASNWAVKPATMIRKVAIVQALREAFPEDLHGMYDSDEMGVTTNGDTFAPIDVSDAAPVINMENDTEVPSANTAAESEFFQQ